MKEFVWLFTVNSRGMTPFGYGPNMSNKQIKVFQNKLKLCLPPEINLNFMSYDIDTKIPKADLIIFNNLDARYLDEDIKRNGLVIPSNEIFSMNIEKIKELLLQQL